MSAAATETEEKYFFFLRSFCNRSSSNSRGFSSGPAFAPTPPPPTSKTPTAILRPFENALASYMFNTAHPFCHWAATSMFVKTVLIKSTLQSWLKCGNIAFSSNEMLRSGELYSLLRCLCTVAVPSRMPREKYVSIRCTANRYVAYLPDGLRRPRRRRNEESH